MILLLLFITVMMGHSILSVSGQTDSNCPAATIDISPCVCSSYTTFLGSSVQIDCSRQELSDTGLGDILNQIPATTKVSFFQLSWNSLTKTPDLTKFTAKATISNSYNWLLKVDISSNPIETLDLTWFSKNLKTPITLLASNFSITSVDLTRVSSSDSSSLSLCQIDLSGNKQLKSVSNIGYGSTACSIVNGFAPFLFLNNSAITQISSGLYNPTVATVQGVSDVTIDLSNNALTNIDNFFTPLSTNFGTATLNLGFNQITSISNNVILKFSGKKKASICQTTI